MARRKFKRKRRNTIYRRKNIRKYLMSSSGWMGNSKRRNRAPELKVINATASGYKINWGDVAPNDQNIILLNSLATGSGIGERIGSKIVMRSVLIRGELLYAPVGGTSKYINDYIRVMLVYDRQANGVKMTAANLLESPASIYAQNSPLNLAFRDRFKVIYDKIFNVQFTTLMDTTTLANNNVTKKFKIYKKLNHLVTYDNTGSSGIGTIRTGALYLCAFNDTDNATTTSQLSSTYMRVRFIDP